MTAALLVTSALLLLAAGYAAGARRRRTWVQRAAVETLEVLRARQADEDAAAAHALPPMVDYADAVVHASRHGVSVREAAANLFQLRARAVLDDRIRDRHGEPGAVTEEGDAS